MRDVITEGRHFVVIAFTPPKYEGRYLDPLLVATSDFVDFKIGRTDYMVAPCAGFRVLKDYGANTAWVDALESFEHDYPEHAAGFHRLVECLIGGASNAL